MQVTVSFTSVASPAPASKVFDSLLAARKYEMQYPGYASTTTVDGVIVTISARDYIDLEDGDLTESELLAKYVKNTQLSASDEKTLEAIAIENSDAYATGFEAAAQGEPRTANPYAARTWDSSAWFAGWDAQ